MDKIIQPFEKPSIKIVTLQDFAEALGQIIEKYNKQKEKTEEAKTL